MDQVLEKKGNALFKIFDGEYSNEFYQICEKEIYQSQVKKTQSQQKTEQ